MRRIGVLLAVSACAPRLQAPVGSDHSEANRASPDAGVVAAQDADASDVSDAPEDARPPSVADAMVAPTEPGMLFVPGGSFEMGAHDRGEGDEHPAHPVTLKSFFLDTTEVRRADYLECVKVRRCSAPDDRVVTRWQHLSLSRATQPVVGVAWQDARSYCEFIGKRLPREAEFERAVRGDDGRLYPWGNEPPSLARTAFGRILGQEGFDDVGSHPSGKGPYGHDDLAGNVWEWMADDYDPYAYRREGAPDGVPGTCAQILQTQDELRRRGLEGFTGSNPIPRVCEKVLRGGAFNYDAWGLRSTNRVHHPPTFHIVMAGFRCAKDAL